MIVEGGFPHSEISGSKPVRDSPNLIAAYHVLHRLSAPRHPPNALKTLDRYHYQCPPLGRGSNHKDWNGIDKKLVILLANVSNIHAVRPGCLAAINFGDCSSKSSPNTFFFTMSNKPYLQSEIRILLWMNLVPNGGARRDRTDDLMLAKHALYQLSYGPLRKPPGGSSHRPIRPRIHGRRWWAQADSNCRPHAYQACALTN